jgi:hypothetical protein
MTSSSRADRPRRAVAPDALRMLEDVVEALLVSAHKGQGLGQDAASDPHAEAIVEADVHRAAEQLLEVERQPPRSKRLRSSSMSTMRSRSLPAPCSRRATDPKTRMLLAPWRAATLRISWRRRRSSSIEGGGWEALQLPATLRIYPSPPRSWRSPLPPGVSSKR